MGWLLAKPKGLGWVGSCFGGTGSSVRVYLSRKIRLWAGGQWPAAHSSGIGRGGHWAVLCAGRTALGASEHSRLWGKPRKWPPRGSAAYSLLRRPTSPGQLQSVLTRRVGAGTRRSALGELRRTLYRVREPVARTCKGSCVCGDERANDASNRRSGRPTRAGGRTRSSRHSPRVKSKAGGSPGWLLETRARRDAGKCSSAQPPR